MALLTKVRGRATLTLAVGAWFLLLALWDVSDHTFCSWCGNRFLTGPVYVWLFDTFGHWGPRVVLIAISVFLVVSSFWLASVTRENEGPSNP